MKISVAVNGNSVSGHFGHCEGFTLYDTKGKKVVSKEFIESPGHKPGFLPVFLKEKGANVIIAGGMGATAQDIFKENGIMVIVGVSGDCDKVVDEFLEGSLVSTNHVCTEHEHEGNCVD